MHEVAQGMSHEGFGNSGVEPSSSPSSKYVHYNKLWITHVWIINARLHAQYSFYINADICK